MISLVTLSAKEKLIDMADKKNLLLLYERPQEPVFMAKGNNSVFDVPDNFYNDRYKPIGMELSTRFGGEASSKITVKQISQPDLSIPMSLDRHEQFSLFLPKHRKIAGRLIDIFMGKFINLEDITNRDHNSLFYRTPKHRRSSKCCMLCQRSSESIFVQLLFLCGTSPSS